MSFMVSAYIKRGTRSPSISPESCSASFMNTIGPLLVTDLTTRVDITTMKTVQNARQKWNFLRFKSFIVCFKKKRKVYLHVKLSPSSKFAPM